MKKILLPLLLLVGCPKPKEPTPPKITAAITPTSQTSKLPAGVLAQGKGLFGVVQVEERDGLRLLTIAGVVQGAAPLQPEKIDADPLVELVARLRPDAKTALVIGLGTGQTAKQLAAKGLTVKAVELEPLVAEYAKKFFDYKGDVTIADGAKFLETTKETYDVIIMDATTGKEPPKELMTYSVVSSMKRRCNEGGLLAARLLAKPSEMKIQEYITSLNRHFYASFGSGIGDEEQNIYAFGSELPFELYSLPGAMLRPLTLFHYDDLGALDLRSSAPSNKVNLLGYLIRLREDNSLALDLPHSEMGAIRFRLTGPEVAALERLLPAKADFPTTGDINSDGETSQTLSGLLGGGGVKRSDVRFSPVIVVLEGSIQFRAAVDADSVFAGKVLSMKSGPSDTDAKEPLLPYGGILYDLTVEKVVSSYTQSSWKTLSKKASPSLEEAISSLKKGDSTAATNALEEHLRILSTELGLIADKLAYYQKLSALLASVKESSVVLTKSSSEIERGAACDRVTANTVDDFVWSNEQYKSLYESFSKCAISWYEKATKKGPKDKDATDAAARLLELYSTQDEEKKLNALQKKFPDATPLTTPPR